MKNNRYRMLVLALLWIGVFGVGCGGSSDPASDPGPSISAAGIGVCNLSNSLSYYTNIMGLVESSAAAEGEVQLESQSGRGYTVVLMEYDDDSVDCQNKPAKLVFAVPDVPALYNAAIAPGAGGQAALAPTLFPTEVDGETVYVTVALVRDPSGYVNEIIQASTVTTPHLTGVGIGVNSLEESEDFYVRVMGMQLDYDLHLDNYMDEIVLTSPRDTGLDLVLMNYNDGRTVDYNDQPLRLVFSVVHVMPTAERIRQADSSLIVEYPFQAKDLNGYLLAIEAE